MALDKLSVKKPRPTQEIVVEKWGNTLLLYYASTDAREWLHREAPLYGELFTFGGQPLHLYLYPMYDAEEVAAYLASGGDSNLL